MGIFWHYSLLPKMCSYQMPLQVFPDNWHLALVLSSANPPICAFNARFPHGFIQAHSTHSCSTFRILLILILMVMKLKLILMVMKILSNNDFFLNCGDSCFALKACKNWSFLIFWCYFFLKLLFIFKILLSILSWNNDDMPRCSTLLLR